MLEQHWLHICICELHMRCVHITYPLAVFALSLQHRHRIMFLQHCNKTIPIAQSMALFERLKGRNDRNFMLSTGRVTLQCYIPIEGLAIDVA